MPWIPDAYVCKGIKSYILKPLSHWNNKYSESMDRELEYYFYKWLCIEIYQLICQNMEFHVECQLLTWYLHMCSSLQSQVTQK